MNNKQKAWRAYLILQGGLRDYQWASTRSMPPRDHRKVYELCPLCVDALGSSHFSPNQAEGTVCAACERDGFVRRVWIDAGDLAIPSSPVAHKPNRARNVRKRSRRAVAR